MTLSPVWLHNRFAETLGWTLLHSLWQLTLLAVLCALTMELLRKHTSNLRYVVASIGLLLMTATPLATYALLLPPSVAQPFIQTPPSALPIAPTAGAVVMPPPEPFLATPITLHSPPLSQRLAALIRPYLPTTVAIYLAGALLVSIRLAAGHARLRQLARRVRPINGPPLHMLHTLSSRLHLTRPIRLVESALIEVPTLIGMFRPMILLPASALTGLSPDQLSALLAHELAHIRRHDYLANLLQSIIETLLFYHPAIWWLSARIRQERENCCDDLAISLTGNRLDYVRALASMESLRAAPAMVPQNLALAARTGNLLARIRRLLGFTPAPGIPRLLTASSLALLLSIIAAAIYIVGCTNTKSPITGIVPPVIHAEQIAIDAQILLVDDATLNALPLAQAQDIKNAKFGFFNSDQFASLFKIIINKSPASATLAASQLTLFTGKPGFIAMTNQQNYIASFNTTADQSGNIVPDYDVSTLTSGFTLKLTATRTSDHRYIMLDVQPSLLQLKKMETHTLPDPQTGKEFLIQNPVTSATYFSTRSYVPDGGTMVLSGLSLTGEVPVDLSAFPANDSARRAIEAGGRHLLIILHPHAAIGDEIKNSVANSDFDQVTVSILGSHPALQSTTFPAFAVQNEVKIAAVASGNSIAVESRTILVSDNFFDDFRVAGQHVNWSQPPSDAAREPAQVAIFDNWTLNQFLTAAQADRRTIFVTPIRTTIPSGQSGEMSFKNVPRTGGDPNAAFSAISRLIVIPAPDATKKFVDLKTILALPGNREITVKGTTPDGGTLFIDAGEPELEGKPRPDFRLILLVRPNIRVDQQAQPSATTIPAAPPAKTPSTMPSATTSTPSTTQPSVQNETEILRDRALTLYNQSKRLSDEALNKKDYAQAAARAKEALSIVDKSRIYFSDLEMTAMNDAVQRQLDNALSQQSKWEEDQTRLNSGTIDGLYRDTVRTQAALVARQQKFAQLVTDAGKLYDAMQFKEAADLLSQAVVIDPQNENARLMLRLVNTKIKVRALEVLIRNASATPATAPSLNSMQSANPNRLIPYADLLVHSDNWAEITRNRNTGDASVDSAVNRAARDRLDQKLQVIQAEQQGFEKVINFLRDSMNANIFVNWPALQAAGIDRNTSVTVSLKDVQFKKALSTILAEVNAGKSNLAYTVDDGIIVISTKADLQSHKYQIVRVFDIRDMLIRPEPPKTNPLNPPAPPSTAPATTAPKDFGGEPISNAPRTNPPGMDPMRIARVSKIIETIEANIAPESWRDKGGKIGSIRELNGQLIVNQTIDNQLAIYDLLQQLRDTLPSQTQPASSRPAF